VGPQELRNSDGRRTDRCGTHAPSAYPAAGPDDHATIDYIWGVIDSVPETNFPDIRNRCVIHSESGSCMVIPREGDKVRLYTQLSDKQVLDPTTGRIDKSKISPDHVLQVKILSCIRSHGSLNFHLQAVKKIIRPYTIDTREIEWWTIYISRPPFTLHWKPFA